MDWVLGHMEDANFNDPIQAVDNAKSSQAPQSTEYIANAEMLVMLTSMGFTERQVHAFVAIVPLLSDAVTSIS